MNTKITLWIAIGVLFVIALFLTFKAGALGSSTLQTAGGAVKSVASSGGMVGGC